MDPTQAALLAVSAYAAVGVVCAALFVAGGIDRVDPGARGAGWGFRLTVLPGCAALWPLVLAWWARAGRRKPDDRREGAETA